MRSRVCNSGIRSSRPIVQRPKAMGPVIFDADLANKGSEPTTPIHRDSNPELQRLDNITLNFMQRMSLWASVGSLARWEAR